MPPKSRKGKQTHHTTGGKKMFTGKELKISPLPSQICWVPWNQAVIVLRGTGDKLWTSLGISNVAREQLGLYTGTTTKSFINIQLRYRSVRVWARTAASELILNTYDLHSEGSGDILKSQYNISGAAQYARLGYEWPASQQNISYESTSSNVNIFAIESTSTTSWLSYLYLEWKGWGFVLTGSRLFGDTVDIPPSTSSLSGFEDLDIQ